MTAQQIMIAVGTVAAGLGRPVQLDTAPSGSLEDLQVTLSSHGVGYVVWEQRPGTQLRLSVIRDDKVVVSDRQLASDAVPLALFPATGGRAALVLDQYGHGTPFLEYGLLSANGRIGRIARIAHPGTHDTQATELSVNPRGELIASWVHNDGASAPGSSPTSPGFVAAQLVVAVCKPALNCKPAQTLPLGATKPACINPTVAISPTGASTVIASADDWGEGCDATLGIRASYTPSNLPRLAPMRLIHSSGDYPVADPVADTGTAIVFNPGVASDDSFGWSFLPVSHTAPTRAATLDRGGWLNTGQPTLAPANNGWYLTTWTHTTRRNNPVGSIRAALGHDNHIGPSLTAVSSGTPTDDYVGATDGGGDALILYNGSTNTGDGAAFPYTSGLYTTILRH